MGNVNRKEVENVLLTDLPEPAQGVLSDLLKSASGMLTQAVIDWGLEVVKHLAIINGAGLAGATALYSSPSKAAALGAMHWFLAGLLIAIGVMATIFVFSFFGSMWFQRKLTMVLCGIEYINALRFPRWMVLSLGIQWLAVAASILAFVQGLRCLIAVV